MATRDPERYFDRRTIKRHLKRGVVAEGDFERYLAGLVDVSDKIKPRDEGGDDDGFDGRGRPKAASGVTMSLSEPDGRDDDLDDDDIDDDDDLDDDDDDDTDGSDDASTSGSDVAGSDELP